jgi:hypothetical protein
MFATYFGAALQGSNVDDELRAKGVMGAGANLDYPAISRSPGGRS